MSRKSAGASSSDAPDFEAIRMLVGANCKAARIKAGLSQAAVSERTGIPQSRVSMIEQGVVNLTLDTMTLLAGVLDLEVIDLLRQPSKRRPR
jgi:transcriptional regulator with XRE-family HTH domain